MLKNNTISIFINGEKKEIPESLSLFHLLEWLEIDKKQVALAQNGNVIPKAELDTHFLATNDKIEIVRMVGGG